MSRSSAISTRRIRARAHRRSRSDFFGSSRNAKLGGWPRGALVIPDPTITASVTFGRDPVDGLFLLSSRIRVALPGVDRVLAEELLRSTERNCPYTKMFRQGIDSVVTLTT